MSSQITYNLESIQDTRKHKESASRTNSRKFTRKQEKLKAPYELYTKRKRDPAIVF